MLDRQRWWYQTRFIETVPMIAVCLRFLAVLSSHIPSIRGKPFSAVLALHSLKHSFCDDVSLCISLLYSATFRSFPPGHSPFPTFPSPTSYLLLASSLYSCVSQLSCHQNELNLSPSVQTTIDRVGTFRKTNRHLLSLLGIGCTVCVSVHVYGWWGWGGRWGTGLCQRGTQGHLLTCHPCSVCWTSKRSRQMMLIILSSPVVRPGGLHSCPCWAPDAYY